MNGMTVLYVDGADDSRNRLARFIAGYTESLFTARDGREGVLAFIACRPELVVADVALLGQDGRHLAACIRNLQPAVPIVFLAGAPGNLADFEEFDPDIDRVLARPVDLAAFSRLLAGYRGVLRDSVA
ncbi:MAG: response regulator [Sulfuricella sp.]|nr:response regulator [Sulfuricella sp.]